MTTATIVPNTIPVLDSGKYDGIWWFRTEVPMLTYAKFRAMPSVVKYNDMFFRKVSFNTDLNTVSYKQSNDFGVAVSG